MAAAAAAAALLDNMTTEVRVPLPPGELEVECTA